MSLMAPVRPRTQNLSYASILIIYIYILYIIYIIIYNYVYIMYVYTVDINGKSPCIQYIDYSFSHYSSSIVVFRVIAVHVN